MDMSKLSKYAPTKTSPYKTRRGSNDGVSSSLQFDSAPILRRVPASAVQRDGGATSATPQADTAPQQDEVDWKMAADSFVQMLLQLECKWNVNEPVFFAEFKDCEHLGKPLTQYGSKFLASERWGYRAKPELIGKLVDVRCPVLHPGAKEALLRFKVPPDNLHTSGPLTRSHTPRSIVVLRYLTV